MKAVFQNTILSLLCMASVVLAAPNRFLSHPKASQNTQNPATIVTDCTKDEIVIACSETPPRPSIEEGTIRFACW